MTASNPTVSRATAQPEPTLLTRAARQLIGTQEGVLFLALAALVVIVGAINPRFLLPDNLLSVLQSNAYIAVGAIGMTLVIISGNIDISVGYLISGLALLCGTVATNGFPIWVAWLVPLFVGGIAGAINGFFVAYLRIPSIVVTLGTLSILKGGIVIVAGSKTIYSLPDGFGLSQFTPFGIPMPVYFMVILTIIAALWMRYSRFARSVYAVGGNQEAARLSGISVRRTILLTFVFSGVMMGIASVLLATQFSQIQATPPPGLELVIITASVVGGVSILGGTGTVIGSTLAAILLSAIRVGMIFVNVSAYWLQAVQGALILITVLADIVRRRRQMRSLR